MSTNKILLKFAKKGINLSPEAYNKVINAKDPINYASSLIVKLKSDKFSPKDLISVSGEMVDEINGIKKEESNNQKSLTEDITHNEEIKIKKESIKETPSEIQPQIKVDTKAENKQDLSIIKKEDTIDNLKKESDTPEKYINKEILEASETIKDEKIKFKRNEQKTNVKYDFKIIQDTSKKSYTSGEIENLISYFKSRYEKLSNILSKRPELRNYTKIADIDDSQENLSLILMVREIRTSKNGHKIIEFEDDTGTISILFSHNNEELFAEAEKLVKDEVIGVIANKSDDPGFAFGQQIIDPGVLRVPDKEMDFGIVFLSDVHIGSLTFLEDAFQRFIDWINCEYGSEEQRRIAEDVKYLVIGGDIVDGIGVYPNQDKELAIKDITEQYNEAARFLGNIRSDIKIIIAPGNHDASRVAEPQPAVPEEYAKALYELDNVEFISNPGVVSLDGINVLIYHGRSFDDLVMAVKQFTHERNDLLMEELLKKRHLAPIYGERTPLASELEDYLVIDELPDIFHTGHVHINTYKKFKGIHLINSGTFQTQTEFQKIYNIEPTPAQVPVIHKGKYKHLKFIE
ncbi:DNA polymerase II small subunit [Methanobrevibacter gottschalkii]|uniref:DNA polymerase II small subunit n=2 Tax=Methanobrevibacter gottschalkii TaxID=190974 RepID=A0A3N5C8I5_9EURY|nr:MULTISPECIES: DNA-directed DNA polymerase II small subunit [Methanobrevibacter]MCQ2971214.1 DNA-directed DNA polymerase II small subunit [archaeon]OEC99919.1 DNA polymerase II [Methanobrevibacter sp. A27]RPF52861.1 DNA polymerase II small subunit [Methanobrevibacter gottschalkii DSM 11977]SEK18893.1 DNA polymerase II small subunit [Methanobrevibacter gottschalkii]